MSTATLTDNIKTRVEKNIKKALKSIAAAKHLDVSDIQREAFRDFIAKPENRKLIQEAK